MFAGSVLTDNEDDNPVRLDDPVELLFILAIDSLEEI
jgi:hypothetical protein